MPSLRPRPHRLSLRTSVIVPCVARHVKHLSELVYHLEKQTVRPDEVVIAVSEGTGPIIRSPLRVVMLSDRALAYAGRNRNKAASASSGDVLIYQDADDLPHPQRVEIAKELFERFVVHHLLHRYDYLPTPRSTDAWSARRLSSPEHVTRYEPYTFTPNYHNGNSITSRTVFEQVKWPESLRRGQDVAYNEKVERVFGRVMARLDASMLAYRQYLSSATNR